MSRNVINFLIKQLFLITKRLFLRRYIWVLGKVRIMCHPALMTITGKIPTVYVFTVVNIDKLQQFL